MTFKIRRSTVDDAPHLPAIERSAGNLFRTVPALAWVADGDDMAVERHLEFIAAETSWVAEASGRHRIAFLCAEAAADELHIWELAVMPAFQRQGIGRALLARAAGAARQQNLSAMTLTTFRTVPWNEPAYQRMGFVSLRSERLDRRLQGILEGEAARGLPKEHRCAMRISLRDSEIL